MDCKYCKEIIVYQGTIDNKGIKLKKYKCMSKKRKKWFIKESNDNNIQIDLLYFDNPCDENKGCSFFKGKGK